MPVLVALRYMGLGIYKRKLIALNATKNILPADVNIYEVMDIASRAKESYIGKNWNKRH